MLKVKIHRFLRPLKRKWLDLEPSNVYQTYAIHRKLADRAIFYRVMKKMTFLYAEVIKDGKTVIIAPLKKRGNEYSTVGRLLGYAIGDYLMDKSLTQEEIAEAVGAIARALRTDRLDFAGILPDSRLKAAIDAAGFPVKTTCPMGAVYIPIGDSYDEWFHTLHKSARQNIRTAYNRAAVDGRTLDVQVLPNTKISRKLLSELIELYIRRQNTRYGMNYSSARKFYFKYLDFPTAYMNDPRVNYYVIMRIDGRIAGFMSGVIDKKRDCVTLVRIAFDEEYARYSPGMIMVVEAAKSLRDRTGLHTVDMSLGGENYKYVLGGADYVLDAFSVTLNASPAPKAPYAPPAP